MCQERWQYHFKFTENVGVFRALRLNAHIAKFLD